jgi:hypothetical protein
MRVAAGHCHPSSPLVSNGEAVAGPLASAPSHDTGLGVVAHSSTDRDSGGFRTQAAKCPDFNDLRVAPEIRRLVKGLDTRAHSAENP